MEASQAAAPPPIEAAAEAPKPAAPLQGNSRKPNAAQVSWQKSLHLHLSRHKRYPGEARSKRVEGVVTVGFKMDRAGKVLSSYIIKGSGSALLDEEALSVLQRAESASVAAGRLPDRSAIDVAADKVQHSLTSHARSLESFSRSLAMIVDIKVTQIIQL